MIKIARTCVVFAILCSVTFVFSQSVTINLYSNDGKEFLGCFSCGKYDSNSIWNKYGTYGSKYSAVSIWNKYGTYGGKYSNKSPWNKYAFEPPRLIDPNGGFYGLFTINPYAANRAKLSILDTLNTYIDLILDSPEKIQDAYK